MTAEDRYRTPAAFRAALTDRVAQAARASRWTVSVATVIALASTRSPSQVGALLHQAFGFLVGAPELGPRDRSRLRQIDASWQENLADAVERGWAREPDRAPDRGFDLGL